MHNHELGDLPTPAVNIAHRALRRLEEFERKHRLDRKRTLLIGGSAGIAAIAVAVGFTL